MQDVFQVIAQKYRRLKRRFMKKKPSSLFSDKRGLGIKTNKTKKNTVWKTVKILFWVFFSLGLLFFLAGLAFVFYIASKAPELPDIENGAFSESSVLLDRTGQHVLFTMHGEENRELVDLHQISKHMQKAMIAAEDADFYHHKGLDYMGIARSVFYLVKNRRASGGGSTLDQQIIKKFLYDKGNESIDEKITRKIHEVVLVQKLEERYSKDEILRIYLNKMPFGRNTYGVEKAAQSYFRKPAADLTIAESAVLASLPQRPGYFSKYLYSTIDMDTEQMSEWGVNSIAEIKAVPELYDYWFNGLIGREIIFPDGHTEYYRGRSDYVVDQMFEKGFIEKAEYLVAKEQLKTLEVFPRKDVRTGKAPHFVDYVEQILNQEFGEDFIERGGLKIITSIDLDMQEKAEEIIADQGEKNLDYNIYNASLISLDPQTGEIVAMVGSRNYNEKEEDEGLTFGGQNNMTTSPRQPGSTFKPIAYAAAFEYSGLAPETVLMDVKTNFGGGYIPNNFDKKFRGPVTIRKSLGNSFNISAIKAGLIAGIPKVYELGQSMGLQFDYKPDHYGATLSLGSSEVSSLQMAQAYASFSSGGKRVVPKVILEVMDKNGQTIELTDGLKNVGVQDQIFSEDTAYLITDILSDPEARGEGWSYTLSLPGRKVAAKTGTSTVEDDNKKVRPHDAWVIGYTPQLVTSVWVGNNKGWQANEELGLKNNKYGALANNASGLKNAGPIWQKFMTYAHEDLEIKNFIRPKGIVELDVSKLSGNIPSDDFPDDLIVKGLFSKSFLPNTEDTTLAKIELEKKSRLLPNEYTPPEAIEEFTYIDLKSYFPEKSNWEKPVSEWFLKEENRDILKENFDLTENIIVSLPTEENKIYTKTTQQNAPVIRITSPVTYGVVSPPLINVDVELEAKNGIVAVDYFWNDKLIKTKTSAPWVEKIRIDNDPVGSLHNLRVEVLDRLSYRSGDEISVKIGEDTTPPEIISVFPAENTTVITGSLLTLEADTLDGNSAIKQVDFFINDQLIKTSRKSPYRVPWMVPSDSAQYRLRVESTDSSGNTAIKTVYFQSQSAELNEVLSGNKIEILSPYKGEKLKSSDTVKVFIPLLYRSKENTIELYLSRNQLFHKISGDIIPDSGIVSLSLSSIESGDYDLQVRIRGRDTENSSRVSFSVE